MSEQDWDLVVLVHLKGAFAMSKAVWPIMRSQKVLLTTLFHDGPMGPADLIMFFRALSTEGSLTLLRLQVSLSLRHSVGSINSIERWCSLGLYGNMGQANYSAAKSESLRPFVVSSFNPLTTFYIVVGLVAFTKTLAREGAKYGIAVNVIAPVGPLLITWVSWLVCLITFGFEG